MKQLLSKWIIIDTPKIPLEKWYNRSEWKDTMDYHEIETYYGHGGKKDETD